MPRALILLGVVLLTGLSAPARAQLSPPPGVLKLPPKSSAASAPSPDTVVAPAPAPVGAVQQDAPLLIPRITAKPAHKSADKPAEKPAEKAAEKPAAKPVDKAARGKSAPVIQAPSNVHAQPATGNGTVPSSAAVTVPPVAAPAPAAAVAPTVRPPESKGTVTGNPLPRWAALRSDDVNLRIGPGTRYPIQWQYHRRDLPVQILRENDVWRLIRDQDGVEGWVHQATLVGHRGFAVKADATLRRAAADAAPAVAYLRPGVVGRLRSCEAGAAWCEVQVSDYRGFLRRDQFYGSDPGEAVGN